MTTAAPAPSTSLIRYSRADFDAYMRLHLHAFIAEHAEDLQSHSVDETQALNDMYDMVHGQSQLDWTMPARDVTFGTSDGQVPTPCVIAVVGVAVGCVALVLQAAGVPSSVSRAVGTVVVDDAIAASPAVLTTLEAEVTALMQADGIYNQAKAIFSLFGSIANVVQIGKVISVIKNELTWYQWMLMGVVIVAQLTLWFTTGGAAAIAELVLFTAAIANLVISATQAYHTCHPSADGLQLHAAGIAPMRVGDPQPGPFVLVDVADAPYAMLGSGDLYRRNADGTWTDYATKVADFTTQLPSQGLPQGAQWFVTPNGAADGEIYFYAPGTGLPPTDTKAAASLISAADDGTVWAIRADRSVIRWDASHRSWTAQTISADQIVPSNANLAYALVLAGGGSDATVVLQWNGEQWEKAANSPEATDILQLATNSAGDLVCVTTDNRLFEYVDEGSTWIQLGGDDIAAQSICIRDVNNAWLIDINGVVQALGPIVRPPENPRILQWDTEDVWDETKSTHLYIVNRSAELVGTCNNPTFQNFVAKQIQPMTGKAQSGPFRTGLCQGLYDADFLPAYNNPNFVNQATWKSHFYDNSSGTNYMGEKTPTALTNGVAFLQKSTELLQQPKPDLEQAGYYLGLALHYFTDLTQPMHAANCTYLDSLPFGYHTDFEGFAMSMQAKVVQPIVTGFQPGGVTDVGQLYQQTSAHFKNTYFAAIDKAHKYLTWKIAPSTWQNAVLPLLPLILNEAVSATAQLLYLYMGLALHASIALDDESEQPVGISGG